MKKNISYILGYLLLIGCMNGQNEINVIVEDEILVSPESFVVKICSISNQILSKKMMNHTNYISQESVLEIVEGIENVKIIEFKKSLEEESISDYLNIDFVEVKGIKYFNILKKELMYKTVFNIEETRLSNIKDYEHNLIEALIEKSKIKARLIANKQDKKVGALIKYIELKESIIKEDYNQINQQQGSGFSVLKEKFIEFKYNGYKLNEKGEMIIQKKIEVTWEIN